MSVLLQQKPLAAGFASSQQASKLDNNFSMNSVTKEMHV
jgi:hypothetical protein